MEIVIRWIEDERRNGTSWEDLFLAGEETSEDLEVFLKYNARKNHWPELTIEEWMGIVRQEQRKEEERQRLIDERGASVIGSSNEQNELTIPLEEDSAWQTYKRKLHAKGFGEKSVNLIEDATYKTLRFLSRNTTENGAIKGLVVGNVQSGKTANMAALIAMAADHGWNMFVVLSGMMNNLRQQTLKRLLSDLEDSKWFWDYISNPKSVEIEGMRLINKDLGNTSKRRYLAVCIKNSQRLKHLIEWFYYNQQQREKVKMLIIDDECDQASINTAADNDVTAINKLILHLVNNHNSKGEHANVPFQAVNYIGYTATPYANVLNDPPGTNSLYPKDFITTLSVSDKYFGPQQIFGYDGEDESEAPKYSGLDIVRNISTADENEVTDIQNGIQQTIPTSLQNAICWFICGVACMRLWRYNKPVSLLIHTSRKVECHNNVAEAINNWFTSSYKASIIRRCEEIWIEETSRFTEDRFRAGYPLYAFSDGGASIKPYPTFESLSDIIAELLATGLTEILINSDQRRKYNKGIHVCIDNSENNDDDNVERRLLYPSEDEMSETAPAFLVIGGNTLSRGLTLEGLISTYFLRPAGCADTLMQMGRWFGYREGYELLPRIWMTQDIKDKFEFISEMDQHLRDEIKGMFMRGESPEDCGPKIMASPSAKWLQVVAKNKRKSEIGAEFDFAGHTKETGVFDNNIEVLETNMKKTKRFLQSLGEPNTVKNNPYADRNKVWKDVPWYAIKNYIRSYRHSNRQRGFNEIEELCKWMDNMTEDGALGNWNVILAGVKDEDRPWNLNDNTSINKVSRTSKDSHRADGIINIGVLRSFNDFVSDIEIDDNNTELRSKLQNTKHTVTALNSLRENLGLEATPQIVIYIIDKDSIPRDGSETRFPLNALRDIAGYSINIPGVRRGINTVTYTHIAINKDIAFDYNEDD